MTAVASIVSGFGLVAIAGTDLPAWALVAVAVIGAVARPVNFTRLVRRAQPAAALDPGDEVSRSTWVPVALGGVVLIAFGIAGGAGNFGVFWAALGLGSAVSWRWVRRFEGRTGYRVLRVVWGSSYVLLLGREHR
jgi:hypothetical protein